MVDVLTFIGLVVVVFGATLLVGAFMAWSSDDSDFMFAGDWAVACLALIVSIMMQTDLSHIV